MRVEFVNRGARKSRNVWRKARGETMKIGEIEKQCKNRLRVILNLLRIILVEEPDQVRCKN